jgi:hypothetical protein
MNRIRKALIGGGLTAAALVGGVTGAAFVNGVAQAQTTATTAPATSSPAPSANATTAPPAFPAHGTPEHEALETPVTGDSATKAQAAAVANVGSGTAGAVTTDATGKGYEVTVTKSDGSQVEVHLDSSFTVARGGGSH